MESIVAKLDAALYPAVCSVNTYLSNYILVFLLVAVGLWYSIKTRFVQVRCCLLYTFPSPRDISGSRMPSSA